MHEIRERIATREPCAKCVRIDEKKKKINKKSKTTERAKKNNSEKLQEAVRRGEIIRGF